MPKFTFETFENHYYAVSLLLCFSFQRIFFEGKMGKSCSKIWRIQIKVIPLHSKSGNNHLMDG